MLSTTTCTGTITKFRLSRQARGFAGKKLLQIFFFFFLTTQICFAQWYQQNSGTTQHLRAVHFVDANTGWAVGDSGTILRTTNGGMTWVAITSGTLLSLNDIHFTNPDMGWIVGGSQTYYGPDTAIIIHTSDGGVSWTTRLRVPSAHLYDLQFLDADRGFAVGSIGPDSSMLIRTTNSGISWDLTYDTLWSIQRVLFAGSSRGWILTMPLGGPWGQPTFVYRTDNGGSSWSLKLWFEGGSPRHPIECEIHDIVFRDANNGVAVGGPSGNVGGYVFRTTNGGDSRVDTISLAQGHLSKVCFYVVNQGTAVGLDGSIHRTTDGGITWNPQTSGTTLSLQGVCFIDASTGWAVGENGTILHTTNGGAVPVELTSFTATANGKEVILNWSTATELNNQGFEIQRKFSSNDFVTIGSVKGHGTTTSPNNYTYIDKLLDAGKYFYRLKQIDFGGKYEYSQTVEINWSPFTTYKLEQNYPNPFNPTTAIGFGIPASPNPSKGGAFMTLKVYDILGNEVKTLVNKEMEAGYHSIDFNASDLPSGVYFYQLRAGSFVETRKMILLR
jgi:photosystem II stability/assembly factor-like uncharacterized protein